MPVFFVDVKGVKGVLDRRRGFTLVELLVVLAVLAIVLSVGLPRFSGLLLSAEDRANLASVDFLNEATDLYRLGAGLGPDEEVFFGLNDDGARMSRLLEAGFLDAQPLGQGEDASFYWSVPRQLWGLSVGGVPWAIREYGEDFTEISESLVEIIVENNPGGDENGYGRTWGVYRYTDLGLDPDDWVDPAQHMVYMPSGPDLLVSPEKGYQFYLEDVNGQGRVVYDSYNLIYNLPSQTWYYHSVEGGIEVDVDTLQVRVKS